MCFLSSLSINRSRDGDGVANGLGGLPVWALFVLDWANMAFCFCVAFLGTLGAMIVVWWCRMWVKVTRGLEIRGGLKLFLDPDGYSPA